MATRTMSNSFEGFEFYKSTFDQDNGTLVRVVEVTQPRRSGIDGLAGHIARKLHPGRDNWSVQHTLEGKWENKYSHGRREAFSPSPETLDISITDWCNFGCTYCYQASEGKLKHAPKEHVGNVIRQFTHAPYQVAIGGGEPTAHPDFPWILQMTREFGSVPNFTTAGHIFRQEVIDAANFVCGGVSLTYHAFKGVEYFKDTYKQWRAALKRPQLNVHVIADRDVAKNLDALMMLEPEVGKLSIILLAYYPQVGRSTLMNIMPKSVYDRELPDRIKRLHDRGHRLAFSEGLLPYFLSRPELPVDTTFASRAEGLFSAYVDPEGSIFKSSFEASTPEERAAYANRPASEKEPHGWENDDGTWTYRLRNGMNAKVAKKDDPLPKVTLQDEWNQLGSYSIGAQHANCDGCARQDRCSTPNIHHYLACAYAERNGGNPPLDRYAALEVAERRLWSEFYRGGEDHKPTPEQQAVFDKDSLAIRVAKWKLQGLDEYGNDPADHEEEDEDDGA